MTWKLVGKRCTLAPVLLCAMARAQETIGHVALQDAMLTGTLEVSGGEVTLRGGASIVARDHTAVLTLDRGGSVSVCSTSSLHVTSGARVGDLTPLLFALDRGALEVRTLVGSRDVVITPDLRFSAPTGGRVDLRLRVTSSGDTCVENRGAGAPTIDVVEQFGDGVYRVGAGQHVLFEHGSVREVVDKESSPCGCPPTPVMSLAENGVTVAPGQAAQAGGQAAQSRDDHPFPAAQSQGLAPTGVAQTPQAPTGQVHAQVAATMAYGAGKDSTETEAVAAGSPQPAAPQTAVPGSAGGGLSSGGAGLGSRGTSASSGSPTSGTNGASPAAPPHETAPVEVKASPPPAPPGAKDLAHRIGGFFKRIFGGH